MFTAEIKENLLYNYITILLLFHLEKKTLVFAREIGKIVNDP